MDLPPRQRNLSQELGLVVRPPSEFYPRTLEEPNLPFEKFDDLLEAMIRGVIWGRSFRPESQRQELPTIVGGVIGELPHALSSGAGVRTRRR